MKDLGVRLASGIIGLALLIIVLILGDYYLAIGLLILSLIGLREFYNAVRKIDMEPISIIGYVATVFIYISYYVDLINVDFIISISVIISLVCTVIYSNKNIKDASLTIMGILYIPILLSYIMLMDGSYYLWVIFLIAFGTDTFAYIIGSLLGKKKLCPEISPKKSVEGALGGIAGSVIVTLIYSVVMNLGPLWSIGILALIGSIISQVGDLTASRIKRIAGIKDYGKIMPGHGGVLDRFDSIIFTAPIVYYYAQYFLI